MTSPEAGAAGAHGDVAAAVMADDWIESVAQSQNTTVFVHGDVWPGTMAWIDDTCCTLIDWKTARVGSLPTASKLSPVA